LCGIKVTKKEAEKRRKQITNTKKHLSIKRSLVKIMYSETPKHRSIISHNGDLKIETPTYFTTKQNIQNFTATTSRTEHPNNRG
jgi:hypothetical protein